MTETGALSISAAVSDSQFEELRDSPVVNVTDYTGMGPMGEFDVFVSFSLPADPVAQCYAPDCEQPVVWREGIHESYCSEECAVEAREGRR